jgi:FkbM family methyltransferase
MVLDRHHHFQKIMNLLAATANLVTDLVAICGIHPRVRRGGAVYELDLDQEIDRQILFRGWEPQVSHFLESSVKAGDAVIEVGANVGAHTLLLARLVGEDGVVHAFEPTTYAHGRLIRNIELNPMLRERVSVYSRPLAESTCEISDAGFRSSWSRMNSASETQDLMNRKAWTVDEFVRDSAVGAVNLIKIDVDGYELRVLKGAENTLKRGGPDVLVEICDYTLRSQGHSAYDLFDFMSALGYSAWDIGTSLPITFEETLARIGNTASTDVVFRRDL